MGMLQNSRVLNAEPLSCFGGSAIGTYTDRWSWNRPEDRANCMIGENSFTKKSGIPNGYAPPYSIKMPIKSGGMSSYTQILGSGTTASTSRLVTTKTFATVTNPKMGSGKIASTSKLIILSNFTLHDGTLIGSGHIATSDLKSILFLGKVISPATCSGFGEIKDTTLLAIIAWMDAQADGLGTLDNSTLKGWADMSADITSAGDVLTAKACAQAVWDALVADYQNAGSMGKALNDAGGAGNPWSAAVLANQDPGSFGEYVQKKLLETGTFIALK